MPLRLLDDNAIASQLRPRLATMAARLADLIPAVPVTSPILVSGDWGSGKTSLLRSVRARLDAPFLDANDRATVWFDAWHHEGEGGLLAPLMRRVWESAPASFRRTEVGLGLLAKLSRFAIALGMRALPLAAGLLGNAASVIGAKLTAPTVRDETAAVPSLGFDSSEPATDPVEELRAAFSKLIESAWGGRTATIFIDDLDRCSPDGAVALLDAIRMLISGTTDAGESDTSRVRFVVAIDRQVVVEAISAKFAAIRGYDGNRYLEKLFPLEFHVPQPSRAEADHLIKELLFDETDERNRLALNQILSAPYFANPRLMKRCINRFRLVRHFEQLNLDDAGVEATSGTGDGQSDQALAEWIAATERWPGLRALMRRFDDAQMRGLLTEFADAQKRAPDQIAPEARGLRDQPGLREWYDRSRLRLMDKGVVEYRAADERLRAAGL